MKVVWVLFLVSILSAGSHNLGSAMTDEGAHKERERKITSETGPIYRDEEVYSYLEQVLKRVLPRGYEREWSFDIRVLENPCLNAFAFPDGVIYIHSGLLAWLENEAQLAVLLAHEIAHVTKRHARLARDLIEKGHPAKYSDDFGIFRLSAGAPGGDGLLRDLEAEADKTALEWAWKAGYDSREALKLLQSMKREVLKGEISFTERPPNLDERIRTHEMILAGYPSKPSLIRNEKICRWKMRKVILETARMELKAGRFNAALAATEKYIGICPGDANGHFLKGEIYRQRASWGDMKRAEEEYKEAVSLDPLSSDFRAALGLLYLKEGEKRLAKRHFEASLSLSPDSPKSAYIRGYLKQCGI